MFSGQRDFRAIAISSSLRDLPPLAELLPKDSVSKDFNIVGERKPEFIVQHGFYYSTVAYASPELLADIRVPFGKTEKYRYDIYVCKWQRQKSICTVLAVPFGKMAADVFGLIEEELRPQKRGFERVNLDGLITQLKAESPISGDLTVTSLRCRVTGGDKVQSAIFSGSDVVASHLYRRTTEALRGIQLVPRRARLRFEQPPTRFSFETDTHGNFWFHVSKDGANIQSLYHSLIALDRAKLIERTIEYPLREGIRREEHESQLASE